MKNGNDSFLAKWQEQQQLLHELHKKQETLVSELLGEINRLQAALTTDNAFFIKDDYSRIVIEIEAHKRLGRSWPCIWSSLTVLADALTPIVGWIVSPNSLWCALRKVKKYENDIQRRVKILKCPNGLL